MIRARAEAERNIKNAAEKISDLYALRRIIYRKDLNHGNIFKQQDSIRRI